MNLEHSPFFASKLKNPPAPLTKYYVYRLTPANIVAETFYSDFYKDAEDRFLSMTQDNLAFTPHRIFDRLGKIGEPETG